MKKVILEEIYRVQELMGVKKNLISEGRIMSRFATLLRDVLNGNSNEVQRAVTRMGNRNGYQFDLPNGRTVGLLDTDVTDILNALTNNTGLRNLSDNSRVAIREILQSLGHLNPENLWNDYVDEIVQMGGNEQNFFRGIQRTMRERNPNNPNTTNTLRDALNQRFPDDPDFVNEIFPYVDSKYADFEKGLLKLRNGRLVREISPDIDDFNRNILSLSNQEIQTLRKSSFIQNVMLRWKNGVEMSNEVKRLFKTLERDDLSVQERQRVSESILEKMNQISNWKSDAEKYLKGFIEELGNSKDESLIELKRKLDSLKPEQGWHVARKITNEMSGLEKEWEAFKSALKNTMSLEKAIYKYMGPKYAWDYLTKQIRKLWTEGIEESTEKAKSLKTGTMKNVIKTGSRRGFPKLSTLADDKGNLLPDFYEELRQIGKNPLLIRSYGYEWFLRTIKWKLYYAFLETLIPAIFLKMGISKEDHQCSLNLADDMKTKNISTSEEVLELISDGQVKVLPPCIQDLVQKDEKRRISKIVLLSDYMVSPGSVEGNYFFPQIKESFLQFSGLGNLTTLFPGYLDDIIVDLPYKIYKYIRLYDTTGVNVREDSENDSRNNSQSVVTTATTPSDTATTSSDTATTSGTQTATLSDEEIRVLLKNWMNTVGGWKGSIIDEDMEPEIMKNLGNNRWQYEQPDGKIYTFEFDPTKKTFKEL